MSAVVCMGTKLFGQAGWCHLAGWAIQQMTASCTQGLHVGASAVAQLMYGVNVCCTRRDVEDKIIQVIGCMACYRLCVCRMEVSCRRLVKLSMLMTCPYCQGPCTQHTSHQHSHMPRCWRWTGAKLSRCQVSEGMTYAFVVKHACPYKAPNLTGTSWHVTGCPGR